MIKTKWVPRPLADLGDLIGYTVLLTTKDASYSGGLRDITYDDIHLEVGEGSILSVDRDILMDESTQLFVIQEVI